MDERELNLMVKNILQSMRKNWNVEAERHNVLEEGGQPDIIITEKGATPIIIEIEWTPALTVEKDAKSRLNKKHKKYGPIKTVIAVKISKKLKTLDSEMVNDELKKSNDISYVVYFPTSRFPESGWLQGSMANLAMLAQSISFPQHLIIKCADIMTNSINKNSIIMDNCNADTKNGIAKSLKQEQNMETWKMASLVIQNAMLFYDQISGKRNIKTIQQLKYMNKLNFDFVVESWEYVLTIDYAPIFEIAVKILKYFSNEIAEQILKNVDDAVNKIIQMNMSRSGDMYGVIFQRLVEDRKQLAAFYTLPESAALLSSLSTPNEQDPIWKDKEIIKNYRIADFACGTGMLLSSVYRRMIINYGIYGNNMYENHANMMENNIIGYDVLPIATHITVASLASIFPDIDFESTGVKVLALGKFENSTDLDNIVDTPSNSDGWGLGSLSLLKNTTTLTKTGKKITAHGEQKTNQIGIGDKSCDIITMNPPFTRNTRTGVESDSNILIPAFGAFGISNRDQEKMRDIQKKIYHDTCGHGHAGLASYFIAIAHRKLKYGGKLGLIVPSTITAGSSWKKVRKLLSEEYKEIILISINNTSNSVDTAFSADTSMSEVMIIAKKREQSEVTLNIKTRVTNVSLFKRPSNQMEALVIGDLITHNSNITKLENGVYGGTELNLGNTKIGEMINCPFDDKTNYNNVQDLILLQFAYNLTRGILHVPTEFENVIDMSTLKQFATMGHDHQLFVGKQHNGPFTKSNNLKNVQYPALWNNDHNTQKSIIVEPNLSLVPKPDAKSERIVELCKSSSHIHYNDFLSYGSQKLVVLYTKQKCIGGTSVPSVIFNDSKYEKAFAIWANSTFGILCNWFIGSRQHIGRSIVGLNDTLDIPILNFKKLTNKQIKQFDAVFDSIYKKILLPVKDLYKDKTRIDIDDEILKILDIEANLNSIRWRFASEPQICKNDPPKLDDEILEV